MPENLNDDPITGKSYSGALLVSSFLLMVSLAWALYDEVIGLRPWRGYQKRFADAYLSLLSKKEGPQQAALEEAVRESAQYKKLDEEIRSAEASVSARLKGIDDEAAFVALRLDAISGPFQDRRAKIASLAYLYEIATSDRSRESWKQEVEEARKVEVSVSLPKADGSREDLKLNFDKLEAEFNALKERGARLTADRAEVRRPVNELKQQQATYFREQMVGLNEQQIAGLQRSVRNLDIVIRQINLDRAGVVDRCQSCHVAMDPKVVPPSLLLTKESFGLESSADSPFTTHKNPEILKIHDPEKFGCSPCHGGNGRATSSRVKGHGTHKYWLWPLFARENVESGCQQCHMGDMVTEHAPVLNRGKELFRQKGCIGCHRFEGFDNEGEQLVATRQFIRQLETQRREYELEIPRLIKQGDDARDPAASRAFYALADNRSVTISNLEARVEQLGLKEAALLREEKKVGPSLKEVRMKLRPEWIPVWLEKTHDFRSETKMPQFRLQRREVEAIAAFIWQSGVPGPALPKQPMGDSNRGDALFESRGCLACHSIGEGEKRYGGDFAANLSRVGEKANYEYLVRWIHNPRERTRPFCSSEKRDIGPEDYAKKGLPFVFDLEHSTCPNDGHQLQVQQPTVMPSLRLTTQEARDIASYIVSQKRPGVSYPPAPFLDNPELKRQGLELVKNYGCAGCHEIAALEEEGRIGTELTTEGSKPIERLDFALLTEPAKRGLMPDHQTPHARGKWYDQKGFFEAKLNDPAIFDQGKFQSQLKMPKPNITPDDVTALTTFLLGSVDPQLPRDLVYRPADSRRDAQEGWWLVTKYNCMGCHQLQIGQKSILQGLPMYQGENKEKLPPPLIGEGARVDPNWLARFLENPALSKTDVNRNGVRSYLQVRMPTFSLSDNEIRKIVRFFEALSSQAQPYLPPKIAALSDAERNMARQLFTHPAAPCLKCHATGNPAHDATAIAPNFLLVRERLRPAWTTRWIIDPQKIVPGVNMPSKLFRREGNRWVFSGPLPPALLSYPSDHADLLVRYMFQLTPEEQRSLAGRAAATPPRKQHAGALVAEK